MYKKKINKIKSSMTPSEILILSFIIIITIGTILLSLPVAKLDKSAGVFTALFTATSAVSVTGLSVVDISKTYSYFGKTVILILIQLGGLGIMTFSSILALLIGRKISYEEKKILKEDLNQEALGGIIRFVRKIIYIVLSIETIGAIFLFLSFIKIMPLKKAIYFSIFHSVSAFCNAGFSLFSTGLEGFYGDININLVISFLIILGGIGFAVIDSLIQYIRTKKAKFNLTSKLALIITGILIIVGSITFFIFERKNNLTIGNMSLFNKIIASFFQSVTTRTAGFNTVSMSNLKPATIFMMLIFMMIGASPGSTGGGIKTTTFGVLVFYIIGIVKGQKDINISNRRISWEILNRALVIFAISIIYVLFIIFLILMIEEKDFMKIIFEVVSAFGTVGLSMGITADLSLASKILIIITMLIGRVGPLTFALALGERAKRISYRYPKENILVG
ncbi:trk system potassium uptake protein TrkH [Hypnocyclicus thermotrophus]|uniref:Trk system potassium uptake protein TrkH n=1 Tax=Hypnocyclicus thermotrophus TaxID=1627895 RepID=A0AA46I5Z3_9FUSO|nr:TrkH family potassium uptake protein [Hypnocyclicus thermotrophus]TDT71788.1 trk system potassium uptake protein TrkH [Hypnocyclicus thermotrophus]